MPIAGASTRFAALDADDCDVDAIRGAHMPIAATSIW
jgi:hypothetical protein